MPSLKAGVFENARHARMVARDSSGIALKVVYPEIYYAQPSVNHVMPPAQNTEWQITASAYPGAAYLSRLAAAAAYPGAAAAESHPEPEAAASGPAGPASA